MIRQLVAKEVREHRWVAIGVLLLAVAQYLALLQFFLRHEPPTALVAATNFVWGTGPMVAAYTARRLFVLEQEQRTIQLLRSLPVTPATIAVTKLSLGLAYNLGLNLGVLWISAWLLQSQEIMTADWVQRLSMQVAVYVFAWFALASFHAQLGGYRFAVWLVLFVALLSLDSVFDAPSRNVFWTAALADDIETTRYETPWDAVGLSLVWGLAATLAAIALATYRGGVWVDAWFAPMSGRRRAEVTGVAIVTMLVLEVASNAGGREPGLLPAVPGEARIKTNDRALRPLVEVATNTMLDMRQRYGVAVAPRALLRERRDHRPELVLSSILKSGALIIGVRSRTPAADVRREIVNDLLTGLTAGHWERVPATGVWALGFAAFVLNDETLGPTVARLAELSPSAIDDFDGLRERFGRRGAEAAGYVAWRAVRQTGGDSAVAALARALFGRGRSQTSASLIAARRLVPRDVLASAGVESASFDGAWANLVDAYRHQHGPPPEYDLPPLALERPDAAPPRLTWAELPAQLDGHDVELQWSVATELHPYAVPADALHLVSVDRDLAGRIVLLDPRLRIIATWIVDGEVQGWREVQRP